MLVYGSEGLVSQAFCNHFMANIQMAYRILCVSKIHLSRKKLPSDNGPKTNRLIQ